MLAGGEAVARGWDVSPDGWAKLKSNQTIRVALSLTNQGSGFLPVFSPNVTLARAVSSKPLLLVLWGHFLSVQEGLVLAPMGGLVALAPCPSAVAGMLAHGGCCAAGRRLV